MEDIFVEDPHPHLGSYLIAEDWRLTSSEAARVGADKRTRTAGSLQAAERGLYIDRYVAGLHSNSRLPPVKMMESAQLNEASLAEEAANLFQELKIETAAGAPAAGNRPEQDAIPGKKTGNCKKYFCCHCNKVFTLKHTLKRHLLVHTELKPYSCPVCDKAFSRRDSLARHVSVHTGEKPHSCPVCHKVFRERRNLNRHHRLHTDTGKMPYSCGECGKAFAYSHHLPRHRRTHTGEKPYHCQGCGVAFSQRGNLVRHQSTTCAKQTLERASEESPSPSAGGEPHPCSDCSASFQDEFQLSHHRFQWHEDRQRLGCTRCRIWFGSGRLLRRHLETHTQGLRFQCGDCQQRFASRALVSSHQCQHAQQ